MFGLLIREGKDLKEKKNIGDFVQSIAQYQYIKNKVKCLVEIEELSDFESVDQVNVIMNGWFTWNCDKFLPPLCINPLFISFHLTPPKENDFFKPEVIEYLKCHGPIGCRDITTTEMMRSHGIDSYFSGCLTLTLGNTYHRTDSLEDSKIYFVDPYIEFGGNNNKPFIIKCIKSLYFTIKHFNIVKKLKSKYCNQNILPRFSNRISKRLEHYIETAIFYEIYSQRFSDDIILNAEYRTVLVSNQFSIKDKFQIADNMLREYANAKFVITSRLHVSFPCLAVGTDNIFVIPSLKTEEEDVKRYSGRLKGLSDTVTTLELEDGRLKNTIDSLPNLITLHNLPKNKDGYKKYYNLLHETLIKFMTNINEI